MIVKLGDGLEEIEKGAFFACKSLREITIPPAIKAIKDCAFMSCHQLTIVNLGEGLKVRLNSHRYMRLTSPPPSRRLRDVHSCLAVS